MRLKIALLLLAFASTSQLPTSSVFAPHLQEPDTRAHAENRGAMGRKNKGSKIPSWEERDDISQFKLAEKRLKRYKGKQTDFSSVLDFASAELSLLDQGHARISHGFSEEPHCAPSVEDISSERPALVAGLGSQGVKVVRVPGRDGLFILPGFLSEEEQLRLAERCLIGTRLIRKSSSLECLFICPFVACVCAHIYVEMQGIRTPLYLETFAFSRLSGTTLFQNTLRQSIARISRHVMAP